MHLKISGKAGGALAFPISRGGNPHLLHVDFELSYALQVSCTASISPPLGIVAALPSPGLGEDSCSLAALCTVTQGKLQ